MAPVTEELVYPAAVAESMVGNMPGVVDFVVLSSADAAACCAAVGVVGEHDVITVMNALPGAADADAFALTPAEGDGTGKINGEWLSGGEPQPVSASTALPAVNARQGLRDLRRICSWLWQGTPEMEVKGCRSRPIVGGAL